MFTRKPRIRYWMSKRWYPKFGTVLHWQMVYHACRENEMQVRESQIAAGQCTNPLSD